MVRIIVYVTIFIVSSFFSIISAQDKPIKPCSEISYSEFNFWIGNWDVYNTKGELIGHNIVVKMPNACAIQENWTSKTSKSKGTSYNYYNKTNNTWNQVWIDNTGFSLVLKGSFKDNTMVLKSDLVVNDNGDYYNRITWTKNKDSSVTQVWDYLDKDNKKIKEVFRGIYKKR
ncbi:conserved hypothetical protein [Tenacibaculum sediminilitoris]|uniref:hypothetical protein n=1 Tax=Tenacibaculum sediminilitoris TaxID=1820334 RepID=UPI003893386A